MRQPAAQEHKLQTSPFHAVIFIFSSNIDTKLYKYDKAGLEMGAVRCFDNSSVWYRNGNDRSSCARQGRQSDSSDVSILSVSRRITSGKEEDNHAINKADSCLAAPG
jgi:hypothetical protein